MAVSPSIRQAYAAGEKLFVHWAADTMTGLPDFHFSIEPSGKDVHPT
jgi:hypothetical protein